MTSELFIKKDGNWAQIEFNGDISFPITFNIADVADFTKKNSSFSKTIEIPGSESNNILFKHLYNIGSFGSFELGKSYEAYVITDSQPCFNGYFELLACKVVGLKIVSYEAILYSASAELFNKLGNKYLRENDNVNDDLDFSDYNHELTYINIKKSWTAPIGSSYLYVPIDKTNHWKLSPSSSGIFNVDEMTPCLYVKEIWDKIFEKAGISYTSSFLNSETFKRLIYPHTDRWLYYDDETCEANTSQMSGVDTVSNIILPSNPNSVDNFSYRYIGASADQGSNNILTNGEFIAEVAGIYQVNTYLRYDVYLSFADTILYFGNKEREFVKHVVSLVKVDLNGNETIVKDLNGNDVSKALIWDNYAAVEKKTLFYVKAYWFESNLVTHQYRLFSNAEFANDLAEVHLRVGEKLKIKVTHFTSLKNEAISGSTYDWFKPTNNIFNPTENISFNVNTEFLFNALYQSYVTVQLAEKISDYSTVPVTQILHKIKQSDFISSIIKAFNLYVEPDGLNNLKIDPRPLYYDGTNTLVDWTDKVNTDTEIKIESGANLIDSKIRMSYASDSDFFNKTYTDATGKIYGEYTREPIQESSTNNEFAIELVFAPTPGGPISEGHSMQIPKIFTISSSGEVDENVKYKPRILYYAGLKQPSNPYDRFTLNPKYVEELGWPIDNPVKSYWPYAGHFNNVYGAETFDLNFQACDWYWYSMNGTWSTWNNLQNLYYSKQITELSSYETKLITLRAKLTTKDINELLFSRPVMIDGIAYKLNKIIDWVSDEFVQVELIKSYEQTIEYPVKYSKPPIIKPIDISSTYTTKSYIAAFSPDETEALTILNIDIIDPNGDFNNLNDTIDANSTSYVGVSDLGAIATLYNIDVIDPNISEHESVSIEEISGTKQLTTKKIIFRK